MEYLPQCTYVHTYYMVNYLSVLFRDHIGIMKTTTFVVPRLYLLNSILQYILP